VTYSVSGAFANGSIITDIADSFSGLSLGANQSGGQQFFFSGDSVTVTFPTPVTAFGVFFNVNTDTGSYDLNTPGGDVSTDSATFDTKTFVFDGVTSATPFSMATFLSTGTSDPTTFLKSSLRYLLLRSPQRFRSLLAVSA
jgi:hypothetical protein